MTSLKWNVIYLTGFLFLFVINGCPKTMPAHFPSHLTPEIVLQNLKQENDRRYQVGGTFLAKSTGLKKLLGSVELDVVAKKPTFLYVSMRSFFQQPARIFATDGEQIYLLELLDSKPKYITRSVEGSTTEEILSLPLTPKEVVEVLLGIVPAQDINVIDIKLDHAGEFYTAKLQDLSGKAMVITVRLKDHVTVRRIQYDILGQKIYEVNYHDFFELSGIDFSHRLDFEVNWKNKSYSMILKAKSIRLNGDIFEDSIFRIDPP